MNVVVMVDLAGFTSFAEACGDVEAAACFERFAVKAMQLGRRAGVRPVKTIGDAVLFVGDDPRAGIDAAQLFLDVFGPPTSLPVHVGVHYGTLVERDEDVYGRAVNVTARLVAEAAPGSALATRQAVAAADAMDRVISCGKRVLRGVREPVEVFRIVSSPEALAL